MLFLRVVSSPQHSHIYQRQLLGTVFLRYIFVEVNHSKHFQAKWKTLVMRSAQSMRPVTTGLRQMAEPR
jgi:hypothetical protein